MKLSNFDPAGLIFAALFLLLFFGTVGLMARDQWQRMRDDRYLRLLARGICPICEYDLRASKDRCPECNNSTALISPSVHRPLPPLSYRIGVPVVACLCIGVFILVLSPPDTGRTEDPMIKAAQAEMSGISTALDCFQRDTGRYPTAQEGLAALVTAPPGLVGWKSPYLTSLPVDPWGHPYIYRTERPGDDRDFVVSSAGPDGREGTKDDISSN